MSSNILLICGSLNQTQMMHAIARHLDEAHCYFTPFYADGLLGLLACRGLLDFTILGGRHLADTRRYLAQAGLPVDFGGQSREYDLVITCTDVVLQHNLRNKRVVLVQEGMIEPEGRLYRLVRRFGLPRFLANTAATGLSFGYDLFCVASPGYRELFLRKGVRPETIAVTGIPNFDNAARYQENDFPHHGFVLVATSCKRESFQRDDRAGLIRKARDLAAGRQLIFKLHPNENAARARREIQRLAPEALIYHEGNVHEMIANCAVLVAQRSSVIYTGLALGKEVHSEFDLEQLRRLAPIQNQGASARRIAHLSRLLIEAPAALPLYTHPALSGYFPVDL